jgi:hypothetical protein
MIGLKKQHQLSAIQVAAPPGRTLHESIARLLPV